MAKSIIRIAILISLFCTAMICIFSEPVSEKRWFFDFFVSKGLGVICIWSLTKLYPRWSKIDKWIALYEAWSMKGIEDDIETT